MDWGKREDGSWVVTPITIDETKFLDAIFTMLSLWKALGPHYEATEYPFIDRYKG